MKVFLDECVDWRLARDIVGHGALASGGRDKESIGSSQALHSRLTIAALRHRAEILNSARRDVTGPVTRP